MEQMKNSLRALILSQYKSESACAAFLGWTRQRLNKLVNGTKEPDVSEVAAIAGACNASVLDVALIFLSYWSPNGQRVA